MRLHMHTVAISIFISVMIAQDQKGAIKPSDIQGQGAFMALVVPNLEASIHWYETNLGLRLVKRGKSSFVAAQNAALVGHNIFVELIHFDVNKPVVNDGNSKILPLGIAKVGMILGGKDFDFIAEHLKKEGVEFIGGIFEDKEMKVRSFLVKDNSGYRIQFFTENVHK